MQPKRTVTIERFFMNLARPGERVELDEWKLNLDKFLTPARNADPERFRLGRKYHETSAELRSAMMSGFSHPS